MSTARTILITGSGAGIGRYSALQLAQKGHRVIASGRNESALASLVTEGKGRIHRVRLDVADSASITAAAAEVDRLLDGGALDVLVNNAGYAQGGALIDLSDADLRRQFDTNVFGLMAVTRALLPALRRSSRGRIINISSIGGRLTMPLSGAYHASKYALEALSDALRMELRPLGMDVAIIEPGPIRSEFAARALDSAGTYLARTDSHYAAAYAKVGRLQALAARHEVGPEVVEQALEHAMNARRPRARYVVPGRMGFLLFLTRFVPTFLLDRIVSRIMGLEG